MGTLRLIRLVYKVALNTHAYKTQAIQTGLIFAGADLMTQALTKEPEEEFKWMRMSNMLLIGITLGPVSHKWYLLLDDWIGRRTTFRTVVQKVMADHMLMAPLVLVWLLLATAVLEEDDFLDTDIFDYLKHEHSEKLLDNYMLWPIMQMFTFLIPINFRVLFQQLVLQSLHTYQSYKTKKIEVANRNRKSSRTLKVKEV